MKVEEKIRTHSLNSANLFSEKRSIYEIMWKDMVETDRQTDHRWRYDVAQKILFACWIRKTRLQKLTKIISYYCFPTARLVTRTHHSVTLYCAVCLACFVFGSENKQHLFPHAALTNVC